MPNMIYLTQHVIHLLSYFIIDKNMQNEKHNSGDKLLFTREHTCTEAFYTLGPLFHVLINPRQPISSVLYVNA